MCIYIYLYVYISAGCRIGVFITLDGAKLMAKNAGLLACMCLAKCCIVCLVVFAWSRVHL